MVFDAIRVSEHVYWVGAIDWEIREFHGYSTSRGTSYNAFLIVADEVTLVDTVKAPFFDEMFARIATVTDPSNIKVVISNHSEMDHSGCLPRVIHRLQPERVLASPMGVKALKAHFGLENITAVADGQTATVGGAELAFFETRMLHWPDSMFTYYGEDQVLFSSDAFGLHLASSERFVDELPWDIVAWETAKYYANILMPFAKLVLKLKNRMEELALPVQVLAPDHGPLWRQDLDKIVRLYGQWAEREPTRKAIVVYGTMWGSTATMARAVCEGLAAGGASPKLMPIAGTHRSDVVTELLDAGGLIIGCPTLNQNMLPMLADVLTYLKGLAPKHLVGAAFGSYGWSSKAVKLLNAALREMDVEVVDDGVDAVYVPGCEELERCRSLGRKVAERLVAGGQA